MKMQELLSSKDKWTQKTYARNKDGKPVERESPDAVKWCLTEAINKCYLLEADEVIDKIEDMIKTPVMVFNDRRSYEEVMELVRKLDL